MTWTRRNFLASGAALALTAAAGRTFATEATGPEIAVFTKSFQAWSIDEVCRKFAELGIAGLDLTVRPGGHVQPEEIKAKLPEAAKVAADHGVKIVQITSSVTEDGDYARDLFSTAGELGISKIKLGYYRSGQARETAERLKSTQTSLKGLVKVAADTGVMPCIHIHSGTYIPSHGTLAYLLLQNFDPAQLGVYVDMLHMSVEGGSGGWRQGLGLLQPWIQLCAVKNYVWEGKGRDKHGQQKWKWETCPLADGISPIPDFVSVLKSFGYNGPYSLHSEYLPRLDVNQCYAQTAADLEFFRPLVG